MKVNFADRLQNGQNKYLSARIFVMQGKIILFLALVVLSLGPALKGSSQPTAGFTLSASACLDESLLLKNTSSSSTNYIWDFCQDALAGIPTFNTVSTLSTIVPVGIKMGFSNGKWYGFVGT